jgi:hypothetical protein
MAGAYKVEWLPGGVLLQRRSGLFSIDEANGYVAAVKDAVRSAPARWGAVVDAREAVAQTEDVQSVIQGLIQYVVAKHVCRVAIVTKSAMTTLQQKRITVAPGMHDPATVGFHDDYDTALAEVRAAVQG